MEVLGIGIWEIAFILLLALIVLGPRDLEKVGRQIGAFIRRFILSPEWRAMRQTSEQLKDIPARLIREANVDLQDVDREVRKAGREVDDSLRAAGADLPAVELPQDENRIAPTPGPVPVKPAATPPGPVLIPQGRLTKGAGDKPGGTKD